MAEWRGASDDPALRTGSEQHPSMPFRVRPLSRAAGAAVTGIDLHEPLGNEDVASLARAFHEHCVLVFPAQHLAPDAQVLFGRRWGELLVVPSLASHEVPGHPGLLRVTNMGKSGALTENWHFDSAFFAEPPPITILAAQDIPPLGGDTMFANQYSAYDALSDKMRQVLDGLRAAFTGSVIDDDGSRREVTTYHPIVRVHPVTRRRALAIGRIESVPHIEGMTDRESQPLLRFLYEHASSPEFVYRHQWQPGDVVMWDNRCLLHYAVHDYGDEVTRLLHRLTVLGPGCR